MTGGHRFCLVQSVWFFHYGHRFPRWRHLVQLLNSGITPLEAIACRHWLRCDRIDSWLLFTRLSSAVEAPRVSDPVSSPSDRKRLLGLHRSRKVVFKLSALFSLDAFAGGFVLQSIVAYWFYVRFNVQPALLGSIFFGANVLAGLSALAAARVAQNRAHQHHGLYSYPLKYPSHFCPFHAESTSGHHSPPHAIQHLSDGCTHSPVLHHGCRQSG